MALPEPKSGLVIRYAYLWRNEAEQGREEGTKDRPCAVVLAVKRTEQDTRVIVAAVTHAPPTDDASAIEIPVATKRRLGLDDARSWIVTSETNVFRWPGPDVRPIDPRHQPGQFAYGFLSTGLTQLMLDRARIQLSRDPRTMIDRDASPKPKPDKPR